MVSEYCDISCVGGISLTTTDYLDGFQYTGNTLRLFPHAEGYVQNTVSGGNNIYSYVFNYTDHLGNIRASYAWNTATSSLKILEENHYYPFGLKHGKYNVNTYSFVETDDNGNGYDSGNIGVPIKGVARSLYQYKYNGKEYQDELGLNMYDYGARLYDPAIGRMPNIDPLAELAYDITPNRYCFNNPVRFIDPSGLWEETATGYKTNKAEDIKRFMSYMETENVALNNSPTSEQTSTFIQGEMSSGAHGVLSDGSILADEISVTAGGGSTKENQKSISDFWHGVQRSLTPDALDPRTIGQQFGGIGGLTYQGPSNPKTYAGNDDYLYMPKRIEEFPAITHDLAYDKLKIRGGGGLFTATSAIGADYTFVAQELAISQNPFFSMRTRFTAGALGIGLGLAALPKTVYSAVNDTYNSAHAATKN